MEPKHLYYLWQVFFRQGPKHFNYHRANTELKTESESLILVKNGWQCLKTIWVTRKYFRRLDHILSTSSQIASPTYCFFLRIALLSHNGCVRSYTTGNLFCTLIRSYQFSVCQCTLHVQQKRSRLFTRLQISLEKCHIYWILMFGYTYIQYQSIFKRTVLIFVFFFTPYFVVFHPFLWNCWAEQVLFTAPVASTTHFSFCSVHRRWTQPMTTLSFDWTRKKVSSAR